MSIDSEFLPTFLTFIIVLIPFYHGASRYLDETYIINKDKVHPLIGLIDFIFFFTEAIFFYIIALLISQPKSFFFWVIALLLLDVIWLLFVRITSKKRFNDIIYWFILNIITAPILFVCIIILSDNIITWIILLIIMLIRTMLDYILEGFFYWRYLKIKEFLKFN